MKHSRATRGSDVLNYIDAYGLRRADASWLLGIRPTQFGEVVKAHENSPLPNPSMGILFRLMEQWPEQVDIPAYPKPIEVYESAKAVYPDLSKRVFGMALGCHPSWATTRLNQPDYASPVVDRLLLLLKKRLDAARTEQEARDVVNEWITVATAEWQGRGDNRLDFLNV